MADKVRDEFWNGPPADVHAWCALDRHGNLMPASVRPNRAEVRLACGECVPIPVIITYNPEVTDV